MNRIKWFVSLFAIICAGVAIFFVLRGDHALLTHPKGIIAHRELKLIATNLLLMLIVVIPTFILLFAAVGRSQKKKAEEPGQGLFRELILWIIPIPVLVAMGIITYHATHQLDPYRPLQEGGSPLTIQVVALDWKWLFIYPEQGIATVNLLQFPAQIPIRFELAADGSPMNSFWIPQLSGQIYTMTGMMTQLHLMADGPGEYTGRAAEINGKGFADMTFVVRSTSQSEFEDWVASIKRSSLPLTAEGYRELLIPSQNDPISSYSDVEEGFFQRIIHKYMSPP